MVMNGRLMKYLKLKILGLIVRHPLQGRKVRKNWIPQILENQTKAWKVTPFTLDMNVLESTWAFKCKRYPDGNI